MTTGAALFIFAHQDDEATVAPRILFELRRGARVFCAFLTDGGDKARPGVRDRESLEVLTSLGVDAAAVHFIGTQIPIRARTLVERLDVALEALDATTARIDLDAIYCLAWEGGNADHDASHLVAVALAQRRGIVDRCWELPLYHGRGTFGPFYRTLSPIREGSAWVTRRLPLREGLRTSLLVWRYRSQWLSWAGLFPETFLKLVVLRRETIRRVDPSRLRKRPHSGPLFYERRFGLAHEQFTTAAQRFMDRHFPSP